MNRIIVDCKENNEIDFGREVVHYCGQQFELEENNVFVVRTVNHFSEPIICYYTICPKCGYIILLKEEKLTEEIKDEAIKRSDEDPLSFKKNVLKSQLIYLESITPKAKVRARINW